MPCSFSNLGSKSKGECFVSFLRETEEAVGAAGGSIAKALCGPKSLWVTQMRREAEAKPGRGTVGVFQCVQQLAASIKLSEGKLTRCYPTCLLGGKFCA